MIDTNVFINGRGNGRGWRASMCALGVSALLGCGIGTGGQPGSPEDPNGGFAQVTRALSGQHLLGAKRDSASTVAARKKISAPPAGGLPSSVMLTNQVPTPGSQAEESCVGWAVGYAAKSFDETLEVGWSLGASNHQFAPSWVYNQINGGVDLGSSPAAALDLIVNKGADTLSSFPYVPGDYLTQPSAASFEHASHFRAKSWYTIDATPTAIKNVLAGHNVVIIVFEVLPDYDNMNATTNTVYDDDTGDSRGGHANVIIGYNDTKGAFRIINSWGTGWGDGGYGWIAYSFISNAKLGAWAYVLLDDANVPIVGDADASWCVDSADQQILSNAFGACTPNVKYDYRADFNADGCVNLKDYQLMVAHWSEGC